MGIFVSCMLSMALSARLAIAGINVCNPAGITENGDYVDRIAARSSEESVIPGEEISVKGADELESFYRLFMEHGWGDGLPLVPPTPERVQALLEGYDLPADMPIAVLPPLEGVATMKKIAVNAVMAGCEAEHLPILVAAVEAASDPDLDLRGIATTTNPDALLVIVSGPVVKQLGLNAGQGSFGRGNRANATISRALHLIIQNVGGSVAGKTDMSTLGQPGDFVMFLAENAAANPWDSFHVDKGFLSDRNVVTVAGVEGYSGIMGIGYSRKQFLGLIAASLRGHDRPWRPYFICVLAQDTAAMLAREGWDRKSMRDFIRKEARIPYSEWLRQYGGVRLARSGVPAYVYAEREANAMVDKPFFDDILFIVAGGSGEKSMLMPCWAGGKIISQEIRMPFRMADKGK